ncbi:hypothetical protein DPMN_094961 [Dreissena polymorpha]|uniref:Uncharacterized protein n=1 Tax=Dreissena polymorpha TaxID=45954 RepID=A0A9D4R2A5_DREPO|nr:hypothetical protein DPMN_094961 [Dreissena polymorpha]
MRKEDIFLLQAGDYFFMRTKCHPDYAKTRSSSKVISLCELRTEIKLEIHVPVLDTITNVTYANKYCAQCNFATDPEGTFPTIGGNLVYWDSSLQCTGALEAAVILEASNQRFNIEAILQTKTCNAIFKPKPVYKLHTYECSVAEIDRCNFTGNMTWYEPWLEKACKAYISIFHGRFKNVFCFLCNTDFRVEFRNCDVFIGSGSMTHIFPEFSSLLVFTPDKNKPSVSKATGCTSEQDYDKHEVIYKNNSLHNVIVYSLQYTI